MTLEATQLFSDLFHVGMRAVGICELRALALSKKIEKKEKIEKKVSDVEMADATRPGPSIQSTIDKAVDGKLRNLTAELKKASRPVKSRLIPLINELRFPDQARVREDEEGKDASGVQVGQEGRVIEDGNSREEVRGEVFGKGRREVEQQVRRVGKLRQEGQGQGQSRYVFGRPSSLPDSVLTMSSRQAIDYVIRNAPIGVIGAAQFSDLVHTSPGVVVPERIAYSLAVGLKYMYHSRRNADLLYRAYNDFERRIRWRLKFTFKDGLNVPYDPDYDVVREHKNMPPPKLPQWLQIGLDKGRRFVSETIAKIPDEQAKGIPNKTLDPSPSEIRAFLSERNYVVTLTDKNLGLAVSERTWLHKETLKLLSNDLDYEPIHELMANAKFNVKRDELRSIAKIVDNITEWAQLKIDTFLTSKIHDGERYLYPEFYGIPKIHKNPAGFRPIIPCHSVVFGPAAKFISKQLKPLIAAAPTVIHGSKDLAIKISKLKLPQLPFNERWYFVTGDVVAFYPNIPLEKCLEIVNQAWLDFTFGDKVIETGWTYETDGVIPGDIGATYRRMIEVFKRCLWVGNTDLITRYQGKLYRQKRGLAMGVADSPDLANLYGCHFEQAVGIIDHEDVAFYGRYIDDCFAIVKAKSRNEAMSLLETNVRFDGCQILWESSDVRCNFLDATFYFNELGTQIHWRPYRKQKNHLERIPWISHHPLDVKRGTFIGEMSRLATLSSTLAVYVESVRDLVSLYVKRGYPEELVRNWVRKHLTERWEKRLVENDAKEDGNVLVLKSEYNTAWNWFNATELANIILGHWKRWHEICDAGHPGKGKIDVYEWPAPGPGPLGTGLSDCAPEFFTKYRTPRGDDIFVPDVRKIGMTDKRLIVSRKRTRNMFDYTSLWKKEVFAKLDEEILSERDDAPITDRKAVETPINSHSAPSISNDPPPATNPAADDSDDEIVLHRRDRRASPGLSRGYFG